MFYFVNKNLIYLTIRNEDSYDGSYYLICIKAFCRGWNTFWGHLRPSLFVWNGKVCFLVLNIFSFSLLFDIVINVFLSLSSFLDAQSCGCCFILYIGSFQHPAIKKQILVNQEHHSCHWLTVCINLLAIRDMVSTVKIYNTSTENGEKQKKLNTQLLRL